MSTSAQAAYAIHALYIPWNKKTIESQVSRSQLKYCRSVQTVQLTIAIYTLAKTLKLENLVIFAMLAAYLFIFLIFQQNYTSPPCTNTVQKNLSKLKLSM